ncbi:HAD-IB family phosphatase [Helicobacter colisuis]|uniref:HAD-IB family phosphatase n=1 Tax=Helicobacter colisuis TaxID=2949739 RepID=UPI00202A0E72|nr:HAD-IB family phosphatase [Helicobacter colisuis]MCL9823170.1 HAD-IB family phosphatase [Helicobacter colisuis]
MIKIIFDLDGTITKKETLPIISKYFNIEEEIEHLTAQTIQGNVPFMESFIKRVHILGKFPVNEIARHLEKVPLYKKIIDFIEKNNQHCVVATGNLDCWIEKLMRQIPCEYYCSNAIIKNNQVAKLTHILQKETLVKQFQQQGYKVIFIGDGNNDVEAMRLAEVSIASGLTHDPASGVLSVADYLVFSEESLCRQLDQLL